MRVGASPAAAPKWRAQATLVGVAVVALTGCTTTVTGVAVPPSAPSGPSAPSLAPRTRDVSVQGVNPCELLTSQQLDQLKENGAPRPVSPDAQRDGPTCAFDVDATPPTYTYYLEAIATADIEDWVSGAHRKAAMVQRPVDVPGFPALVSYVPAQGGIQDCETLVGVAEGQTLRAQVAPDDASFSQDQLCEMSTNLAKVAAQTLLAGAPK
ncbi:DUF3558 domain-containing protein [Amycolatopsis taiwanensis]|uniref:DUF3558 domain-containing protein n=1 Tax=Amycolatopsis taiwanensis TaxID=342230 RepID=UPI002554D3DF|nr:DUF3558 domain-containing protein [Amycolatopsis taiwanensis]